MHPSVVGYKLPFGTSVLLTQFGNLHFADFQAFTTSIEIAGAEVFAAVQVVEFVVIDSHCISPFIAFLLCMGVMLRRRCSFQTAALTTSDAGVAAGISDWFCHSRAGSSTVEERLATK
jgi:hypothetical protein